MTKLGAWKSTPVPRNTFLPARVIISAVFISILTLAMTTQAQVFTTLVNFHGSNGDFPLVYGSLSQGVGGDMYGTTKIGGANQAGTIFVMTPAGKLTTLYSFCSQGECEDGGNPYSGLVVGTDGNFYGTANVGGGGQFGTIFRVTPKGVLTTLYSFPFTGGSPYASLIQASDGFLYGTTANTVFKMTLSGVFTLLHTFQGADGINAMAALVQASDGNLYGTTASGGSEGAGTVYRITPDGKLTTLYNFCSQTNCSDGNSPYAPLVQGLDGNLYGTTSGHDNQICAPDCGTIFKMALNGALTTLHVFLESDGAYAYGGLAQGTDGNFYGITLQGGSFGFGTIYEITPGGALVTLHNFDGTDGELTSSGLFQYTSGVFYGPTYRGGNTNGGTLFGLNTGLGPFVSLVRNPTKVGQQFGILGQGFKGTTSVSLNGQAAAFSIKSGTLIIATVPQGATAGYVTVTTPNGTLTSNVPFRVLP